MNELFTCLGMVAIFHLAGCAEVDGGTPSSDVPNDVTPPPTDMEGRAPSIDVTDPSPAIARAQLLPSLAACQERYICSADGYRVILFEGPNCMRRSIILQPSANVPCLR